MRLMIASNNAHKIKEIKTIVGDFFDEVLSLREAGIEIEIEENGATFAENARIKAETICRLTGCAALADDSGLAVDALDGAPGVYSARYAGEHGDDSANNALLRRNLASVPAPRSARFVCAIVLARPDQSLLTALGECSGSIAFAPRGENGFGYDPFFVPDGYDKTFAELSEGEKNTISHRARALEKLKALLKEERN